MSARQVIWHRARFEPDDQTVHRHLPGEAGKTLCRMKIGNPYLEEPLLPISECPTCTWVARGDDGVRRVKPRGRVQIV